MTTPKASRAKLIKQIQKANPSLPDAEAVRFAELILSWEPVKPKPPGSRYKLSFGKHAGKYLDECPDGYVRWLAEITEEKKASSGILGGYSCREGGGVELAGVYG